MTTALGSVLEPGSGGGVDLRAEVRVAPSQLGGSAPVIVALADELEDEAGRAHQRVASPHDRPGTIALGLPSGLRDGTTLRLRGQGARETEAGPIGDLYVTVVLDESATALSPLPPSAATPTTIALIVAAAVGSGALFVMCA